MRIEIFVVNPYEDITHMTYEEKKALENLEGIKMQIIAEFGGLTETNTEKGYWIESKTKQICIDSVKRWIIYTTSKDSCAKIEAFSKQIKAITAQKLQCFGINDTLFFI